MQDEKNISGVSENLADSIAEEAVAVDNKQEGILANKQIAISVSESEELEQLGLSNQHIQDISIEIARYLIVSGATMLYGGDLRAGGFTEIFSDLSYQYSYLKDKRLRFVNYFPFPSARHLTTSLQAEFLNKRVDVKILENPKSIGEVDTERTYDPTISVVDRFIFAECFADMREKMASDSDARIILGGKQSNFLGYVPGIVEEAYYSLDAKKPLYLLGGFGGATKSIISTIKGEMPEELTNEFQYNTDFLEKFKNYSLDKSSKEYLDYDYLAKFFQKHSVESVSELNGLSIDENQILFESNNIYELIFLVIKGLQNISTSEY